MHKWLKRTVIAGLLLAGAYVAGRAGLDEDFAEEFIRRVMAEVVRQHRLIARGDKDQGEAG